MHLRGSLTNFSKQISLPRLLGTPKSRREAPTFDVGKEPWSNLAAFGSLLPLHSPF